MSEYNVVIAVSDWIPEEYVRELLERLLENHEIVVIEVEES